MAARSRRGTGGGRQRRAGSPDDHSSGVRLPMHFHQRRRVEANIDLTPMIDTILQLFLIFLLTSSFLVTATRLTLPKAAAAAKQSTTPVVVALDESGRWLLNREAVNRQELSKRLEALFAEGKPREVTLQA